VCARERERVCVYVCVCVLGRSSHAEKERERVCVCVCVCVCVSEKCSHTWVYIDMGRPLEESPQGVRASLLVREREGGREGCLSERERERESVCVCVCVRKLFT